MIILHDAGHLW